MRKKASASLPAPTPRIVDPHEHIEIAKCTPSLHGFPNFRVLMALRKVGIGQVEVPKDSSANLTKTWVAKVIKTQNGVVADRWKHAVLLSAGTERRDLWPLLSAYEQSPARRRHNAAFLNGLRSTECSRIVPEALCGPVCPPNTSAQPAISSGSDAAQRWNATIADPRGRSAGLRRYRLLVWFR